MGASLHCSALSYTNCLLKRLVAWFTEDCKGTDQLALTKNNPKNSGFCNILNTF